MHAKLPSQLSGIAGEYLVAAELSRRGYIASITLRNTRGIDILASNADASRSVGIQVKTYQGSKRKWILTKKADENYADKLFYVLVTLNDGREPDFFVVPSKVLADHVREGHQWRITHPGRHGQFPKDNPIRVFQDEEGQYLGQWDLLRLDAAAEAAA